MPRWVRQMNDFAEYDVGSYDNLSLEQVIEMLRGSSLALLKRGSTAALVARREWGGLLVAASRLVTNLSDQMQLFRRVCDLDYSDARRHMKLWVFWPRIQQMLEQREDSCRKRNVPFVVPGYRRCLSLAGVSGKMAPAIALDPSPPPILRDPLPTDVASLTQRVEMLELQNRLERERSVKLVVELDITKDELSEYKAKEEPRQKCWFNSIAGWFGGKSRRSVEVPPISPSALRATELDVRIGNCLDLIESEDNVYDAIVTDPPYEIGLHGYEWDNTEISFSPDLWNRFYQVLKPGGYIAFFAAPRMFHRAALACETAGFNLYPFMGWRFRDGLPKPINLSELFDRDNLDERETIGLRAGSGFTTANVEHGAQRRSHTKFAKHARHVSLEAQAWKGYYYGVNTLKPSLEPILLAQKPISTTRMIDNIRQWGTGALNVGALNDHYGFWPSNVLTHRKAQKAEHQSDHPSVKPVALMEDLCVLLCPSGGRILDPFAGTGTTGVAARNKQFDCVLIEKNANMKPVIEARLGL